MNLAIIILLSLFANLENKERLIILFEDNRSAQEAALYEDAISIGLLPDTVTHISNLKFTILDSLYSIYLPYQNDSFKNIPREDVLDFFKDEGDYLLLLYLKRLFVQQGLWGNRNLIFTVEYQIYDLNSQKILTTKIWKREEPIPKSTGCFLLSFIEDAENTINATNQSFRHLESELDDVIRGKKVFEEFEVKEFNNIRIVNITPYAKLANYSKLNLVSIMVKPLLCIYGPSGYESSTSYFYFWSLPFAFFPHCLFNDLYQGNLGLTGLFLGTFSGITIEYFLFKEPFGLPWFFGIFAGGFLGSKIPFRYDFKQGAFKNLKFSTTIFYQIGSDPELGIKGFGTKEGVIYNLGFVDLSLFFKTIGLASKSIPTSPHSEGRLEARIYQLPIGLGPRIGNPNRDYLFIRFEFIPSIFATGGYLGPEGIEFKSGFGIETGMNIKPGRLGITLTIGKTIIYSSRWSDFLGRPLDLGGIFFSVGFAL